MASRFWIGTLFGWHVPEALESGTLCNWMRGQEEICPTTERSHHQVVFGFQRPVRLAHVKRHFGEHHFEATRSAAADEYVWKEETRVEGTQFELGAKSFRRNVATDWEAIKRGAMAGDLSQVPADIFVRHYCESSY